MRDPIRSCLTVGVTTIAAAAVAFGPAVQEPRPVGAPAPVAQIASPPVRLVAQVQPLAVAELPNLLAGWVERFIVPPSASQAFPAPPSGPAPAPQSLTGTLEWAYHAIEPWVRYGFELATYAVGWIPWVGWLSGQIMIFYNFGESIVHAIAHNTLDWLGGNGSFLQNVGEGIAWTIDAFIQLGIDQWNFWLPSLPPLPFAAAAGTTTTEDATTLAVAATTSPKEKHATIQVAGVADTPDEEAAGAVDETNGEALKTPKVPKGPRKLNPTTEVTAAAEDGAESNDDATDAKNAPTMDKTSDKKKADKGPKAATQSSVSTKANHGKGENKTNDVGEKKKDSGKKDHQ